MAKSARELAKERVAAARANAGSVKEAARQKALQAKHDAQQAAELRKNPPPVYVDLPEASGDAVADTEEELDAVQAGFRQRAKDEGKRFFLATDSEYYAVLCFQTREQKEAFLTALKLLQFGDKYLDGALVAKQLGIELPKAEVIYNTGDKVDPKWLGFVDRKAR